MRAFAAGPAEPALKGSTAGADRAEGALPFDIEEAVVEGPAHSAGLFPGEMSADLFGDGGAVLAKDEADLLEGSALIEFCLDDGPGIEV